MKIKKKKKKNDCFFSFKNLINYFFKLRNKDFFFIADVVFLMLFIYLFLYAMSSFSVPGKQFPS